MARRESDYSRPTVRRRGMRTGYTTGACAAAAAKAATLALLTGEPVREVTIRLPIGKDVSFAIHRCEIDRADSVLNGDGKPITTTTALCSVIKDGGDDPDVTSGAEICAKVWLEHDAATYAFAAQHVRDAADEYSHSTYLAEIVNKGYYYESGLEFHHISEAAWDAAKSGDVVATANYAHQAIGSIDYIDQEAEEAVYDIDRILDSDKCPASFDEFNQPEEASKYFEDMESVSETLHECYSRGDKMLAEAGSIIYHGRPIGISVNLRGGDGIGTVTKPGTGIEVGAPSITRVPRRMLKEAVTESARAAVEIYEFNRNEYIEEYPHFSNFAYIVEIAVPGGQEIAKKTDNPRLGIVDGISILGTTGVVQPFSTAAWRASVNVSIDVAAANDLKQMVITTGTQSENFAKRWLGLEDMSYVNVGIFTGAALKRCVQRGIPRATLVGMIGKFSKIAQGYFVTHVAGNKVDPVFLASLAAERGAHEDVQAEMRNAASGRHFQEIAIEHNLTPVFDLVCELVCEEARKYLGNGADGLIMDAICFDFEGGILGKATTGANIVLQDGQDG